MSGEDELSAGPCWRLTVVPDAGEAGGSFQSPSLRLSRASPGRDPERSASEGARRARSKVRRYCAANRLNRLGTLTYRGDGCHDPLMLRRDVAEFWRRLRSLTGRSSLPYVWTPEWHKSGHGLHVHFAVGEYTARTLIDQAWGRGFVHIKLLGDLPVGSGTLAQARLAARYLSKYVSKDFDGERMGGLHRYEVGQGFQPATVSVAALTRHEAIGRACAVMGGQRPEHTWVSDETEDWSGPPAVWLSWPG